MLHKKTVESEQIESSYIISKENVPKNEYLQDTPSIPKFVYENLPPIFYEACTAFKTEREKDIFLTGLFTVLSGCLPTVSGVYNGNRVNANLFSFIVAPAASGKGVLKWSKQIGLEYHKHIRALSKIENDKYEIEINIFNQNKVVGEKPIPPKTQTFFSPGDTSKAKLIEVMDDNIGSIVIFETEADTLSGSIGKEWGGFSDLFRRAFHHESYSYQRKANNQFIDLDFTKLSVCLSGTPMQVQRLIPSAEDGLFSRFMFYAFKVEAIWQDVSPQSNKVPLDEFFAEISIDIKTMILHYEKHEKINFTLQQHQWDDLNKIFSERLERIKNFVSEDAISVVKRLGLINFRLAMILSIFRKYDCGSGTPIKLECEDVDFEISIELTEIYLEHAMIIFGSFTKQNFSNSGKQSIFFEKLKPDFKRNEADKLGESIGISEKTVHNYLKAFEKHNLLISPTHGFFKKI
ncbi:MAG: DUF3987 domain-containing protein [Bacteroidota bacterium]